MLCALIAQTNLSAAEPSGSELMLDVAGEAVGGDPSIALQDVSGFPPEGAAIFEPGSPRQEQFTYSGIDAPTNRLVGLARPAPVPHSAGALVTPISATENDPLTSVSSTAPPLPPNDAAESTSADTPDPCYGITGKTCVATITDPVDATNPCENVSGKTCVETVVDPLGLKDPCDPDNTGRSCLDALDSVEGTDPCDPNETGQTCLEYIAIEIGNTDCVLYELGCDQLVDTMVNLMVDPPFCDPDGVSTASDTELVDDDCAAWITALDPGSPPRDCASRIEYGLICAAYAFTLTPMTSFESNMPVVPAQPTEVYGIPLPPPASGPGSNLDCSFHHTRKVEYENRKKDVVARAKARADWCGNDGTGRIRYWTPSYDVWIRWDWRPTLDIYLSSHSDECGLYAPESERCTVRKDFSSWEQWRGWCPACRRYQPLPWIHIVGGADGSSNSEIGGW